MTASVGGAKAVTSNTTKRPILRYKVDGAHKTLEPTTSTEQIVQDLSSGVTQHKASVVQQFEKCKQHLDKAYRSGMLKLSTDVKSMKLNDFRQAFGVDLVTGEQHKQVANPEVPTAKEQQVVETPARLPNSTKEPGSLLRTVKKGENLFSVNGSPLEAAEEGTLTATVTKKRKHEGRAGVGFEIALGDGKFLNLQKPDMVKTMDEESKTKTVQQLKALQDQMDVLMRQLEQS